MEVIEFTLLNTPCNSPWALAAIWLVIMACHKPRQRGNSEPGMHLPTDSGEGLAIKINNYRQHAEHSGLEATKSGNSSTYQERLNQDDEYTGKSQR